MKGYTKFIFILLLVTPFTKIAVEGIEPITATITAIGLIADLIGLAQIGSDLLKTSIENFNNYQEKNNPTYKEYSNEEHDILLGHLKLLAKFEKESKANMEHMKNEILGQMFQKLPGLVELNNHLTKVFTNFDNVDSLYEKFLTYYEKLGHYDRNKIIEFANSITSDTNLGLNNVLEETHRYLIKNHGIIPNSLTLLLRHMQVFLETNQIAKTPQQLLNELLLRVMYTEIKGLLTIRYSYEILNLYEKGNFTNHIKKTEYDFGKRANNTLSIFQQVMSTASREISKNNPPAHIEGETYTELKNVFREFVINEKDINDEQDCSNTCSDYRNPFRTNIHSCSHGGDICEVTTCDGSLHDCRKIDTDMSICKSNRMSNRFYDYIDYNNGYRFGSPQAKCSSELFTATRYFELFNWCDPCFCICADSTSDSERYFNLDPVKTNTAENYVVTGARLVKRKNMMHIQIREGQLLPNGRINASTLQWSKINENPTRYYTLQWNESREINFHDLDIPKNYVLTGLSFESFLTDSNNYAYRLHLKAFAAPLNYYNGILNLKNEMDFVNYKIFYSQEIDIKNRDIPTRTTAPTNMRSTNNQYLKFGPTGLDKDVGQSTIPFIDIQEVATDPPVPMTSAGLFFRSSQESGGFISIKLFSYDYSQHIEANLPDNYKDFESYKLNR